MAPDAEIRKNGLEAAFVSAFYSLGEEAQSPPFRLAFFFFLSEPIENFSRQIDSSPSRSPTKQEGRGGEKKKASAFNPRGSGIRPFASRNTEKSDSKMRD